MLKRGVLLLTAITFLVSVTTSTSNAAGTQPAGFGGSGSSGGYVITPRSISIVSSQWVVPRVTCSAPNASVSFAVGLIDGVSGRFTRLGVDVDCHAGQPAYGAYIRLPGGRRASLGEPVWPGDSISASMSVQDGKISAAMSDTGRRAGWYAIIDTDGLLHPTQGAILATLVRTPAGGAHPLANFGTVRFTHSRVNTHAIDGRAQRLTMRGSDGQRRVKVSPLDRRTGAFSITWRG